MSEEEARLQYLALKEPPSRTPPGRTLPGRTLPGRTTSEVLKHNYPKLVHFSFPSTLQRKRNKKQVKLGLRINFNEHCKNLEEAQDVVFVLTGGKLHFTIDGKFIFANPKSPLSPPFEVDQVIVSNDAKLGVSCIFYKGTNSRILYLKGNYDVKHLGNIRKKKKSCSLNATFKVTLQDIEIIDNKGLYPSESNKKIKTTIKQMIKKDCFKSELEDDGRNYLLSKVSLLL